MASKLTEIFAPRRETDFHKTRNPSHTKAGPGRRHVQGDGKRTSAQRSAGAYGRGLRNHFARLNRDALEAKRKG